MRASDICAALRARYKQPEWALFFEVGSGTGSNCKRHADALAMNMYRSRGQSILGFEIKVSRGDLKRELDTPDKAEEIAQYCDEWYLAVPKGLIREDDPIPVSWGVIECDGENLRITKKAGQLKAVPVTRDFVAAVLRSAGKVDEDTIQQERNKVHRECEAVFDHRLQSEIDSRMKRYEETQKRIDEFEKITGKRISSYTDVEDLARNIQLAEQLEVLYQRYGGLQQIRDMMSRFLERTEEIIGDVQNQKGA